MPYGYAFPDLLGALSSVSPAKVDVLRREYRAVDMGRLPVGLKIHCLGDDSQFLKLVDRIGGRQRVLEINFFKGRRASMCLVLPPVGSVRAAQLLLECLGDFTGIRILGNRDLQLQVCSPGRLSAAHAALLAIGFYLGSDTLRRYSLEELETTFSTSWQYARGRRLVLYDAEGEFDRDFDWWSDSVTNSVLPMTEGRTDLLAGAASLLDIENINLIASLLVHLQFKGRWAAVGAQFEKDMMALLDRHMLRGLVAAPWIYAVGAGNRDGDFLAAMQELTAYAFEEAVRVRRRRLFLSWIEEIPARCSEGILSETRALLDRCRAELAERSSLVAGAKREGH